MIVGSISENKELERRVAITPDVVKKYVSQGFKVLIEKDYGNHLGFSDKEYQAEGCEIELRNSVIDKSNILLQLDIPDQESLGQIKANKILIGTFNVYSNEKKLKICVREHYGANVSAFQYTIRILGNFSLNPNHGLPNDGQRTHSTHTGRYIRRTNFS